MSSDDFAAFAGSVPGLYWMLNASPYTDRAGGNNHSPRCMVDEQHLKTGVKALVNVALEYLGRP